MGEAMRVLDLFSGVGAYSLGLERTGGFRTVAFCEIEEYPRRILRKHWPEVPIYEDVRALTGATLRDAGIVPQWIVAGWPCQDISVAGTGSGLDGARSGLWGEIARLAGELGLDGLLLENSSNLLSINGGRDFGTVLGDLAALGFDAEWHCLPAAAFDAPHIRDRLWIVAHRRGTFANAAENRQQARRTQPKGQQGEAGAYGSCNVAANADGIRAQVSPSGKQPAIKVDGRHSAPRRTRHVAHAHSYAPIGAAIARRERHTWEPEPDVVRVVHGCANRVDRIAALGNLNPPCVPEALGRAILTARTAA